MKMGGESWSFFCGVYVSFLHSDFLNSSQDKMVHFAISNLKFLSDLLQSNEMPSIHSPCSCNQCGYCSPFPFCCLLVQDGPLLVLNGILTPIEL